MEQVTKKESLMTRIKNVVYPLIMTLFVLVIIGLFFMAAEFLSMSVNSAISTPDEAQIQAQLTHINLDDYARISEKLSLPAISAVPSTPTELIPETTATSSVESPEVPPLSTQPTESKDNFSLAVFNSTKKSGVANTVKSDLVAAGFTVTRTGNTTPQVPETTIKIKERVQASPTILEEILSLLGKRYTVGDPQILEDTSPYDIVITIGAR